jgi:hypothetical protein
MALFSGKIIDARYIDLEYSLVELTYTGDDGNVYAHALRVDENNQEWLDLLAEGWDQERLLDGTAEYKRQASADFNGQVNELARKLAKEMIGMKELEEQKTALESKISNQEKTLLSLDQNIKIRTNQANSGVYDHIMSINTDKEELFKFKLWALEQEAVQNSDKDVKSKIRKCTNIIEGLFIVNELLGSV